LTLSKHNSEQAKKNKHYPDLGPSGYHAKQEVFRKMDEVAKASGDPKKQKVKNLKPHLKQWIYTRSMDSSDLVFAEPKTEQAVSRIMKYAEDTETGMFVPSRER
jgi:hypothetical protein